MTPNLCARLMQWFIPLSYGIMLVKIPLEGTMFVLSVVALSFSIAVAIGSLSNNQDVDVLTFATLIAYGSVCSIAALFVAYYSMIGLSLCSFSLWCIASIPQYP